MTLQNRGNSTNQTC
jgi:hypothetical protein